MIKKRTILSAIALAGAFSLLAGTSSMASPYTVAKGDNLWKIAREKLGDGKRYVEIFEANKDQITDPSRIQVGQVLEIPDGTPAPEVSEGDNTNDITSQNQDEALKARWKALFTLPDYAPNNEITDTYDEALAAKCVNGTFVGLLDDGVKIWRGIPYAKQPVGDLRFRVPQAPEPSDSVYEAYHFMKSCMQPKSPGEPASRYEQGEECLGLNVWSAMESEATDKPVFVFIHGGGWYTGGTSDPLYNGYFFAANNPDILVVTIDYRLGMLGQIVLSDFPDGGDYPYSEDLCMLDIIQSLKWMKENIAAFGGDPDNITVCGESAGAGAVSMLCTMPEAKGLFGKAIPMSGSVPLFNDRSKTKNQIPALIEKFGAKTVADLQSIPFEELREWWAYNAQNIYHHPVRGNNLIEEDPINAWKQGDSSDIIIMQGHTANEYRYYHHVFADMDDMFDAVCEGKALHCLENSGSEYAKDYEDYLKALEKLGITGKKAYQAFADDKTFNAGNIYQAQMHAINGGKGYFYTFEKGYDGELANLGAAHGVDCSYLFGTFNGDGVFGTADEIALAKQFQEMIANFCKTGDPSVEGLKWPEYNTDSRYRMMIGENMRAEENPEGERVDIVLRMMEHSDVFCYGGNENTVMESARRVNPEAVEKYLEKAKSFQE